MLAKYSSNLALSFLIAFCTFTALNTPAYANTGSESLPEAIFQSNEVVLDGTVDFSEEGTLLYTSDEEYVVVLEGINNVGLPGQHIMVVGFPYKKDNVYYLNVTGYTFISDNSVR